MKYTTLFLAIISIILSVNADTTFFENSDNAFIIAQVSEAQAAILIAPKQVLEYTKGCIRDVEITAPEKVFVEQQEVKELIITVRNSGNCILYEINVSLILTEDWKADSFVINKLYKNESQTITLKATLLNSSQSKYKVKIKADMKGKIKYKDLSIFISEKENTSSSTKEKTLIKTKELEEKVAEAKSKTTDFTYLTLAVLLVLTSLALLKVLGKS